MINASHMSELDWPRGSLEGRRILVTGASRSIAAGVAYALGQRGADVAIHFSSKIDAQANHDGAAETLVNSMEQFSGKRVLIDQDLADDDAGELVVAKAEHLLGSIDSVVLSASVQIERAFAIQTPAEIDLQCRVNLTQNIAMLQALLPKMSEAGFGRVISIGSVQERVPNQHMPIYSLTKTALRSMIEGLAIEYAGAGITLNTLSPGLIETDRNARFREDPESWQKIQSSANPLGRAGKISDLLPIALHLLARESDFITGSTFSVSGGGHLTGANCWA